MNIQSSAIIRRFHTNSKHLFYLCVMCPALKFYINKICYILCKYSYVWIFSIYNGNRGENENYTI